jgi:SAM-dependent methyltransferase
MSDIYTSGEYLGRHPGWHAEDSAWKAAQIRKMIVRNRLSLRSVSEAGCGAGEILRNLQAELSPECVLHGYDISPQAIGLCQGKENAMLRYFCADFLSTEAKYDACLVIDVIEHIEDYFEFLRRLKPRSDFKILHVPLDMSAQAILRDAFGRTWDELGHLHFFTRDTVLRSLAHCDYEILDWFYTNQAAGLQSKRFSARVAKLPRRITAAISEDFAARVLGGFSMMVLAK